MSAPGASGRAFVSESALDFLLLEATRRYMDKGEAGRRALHRMGFQVGAQLAERHTKDRARFADSTEVVLFVCKEFWPAAFGKRVDSLKTNNKGTFVLTDNAFRWTRTSPRSGPRRMPASRCDAPSPRNTRACPRACSRASSRRWGTPRRWRRTRKTRPRWCSP